MLRTISELDLAILGYINEFSEEKYDVFWLTATKVTTWIPLFLLMFYLIYANFSRKNMLVILISVLLTLSVTMLFTELIKELVMRLRPNNNAEISGMLRILKTPSDYSFFSGHASNSTVVATLIVLILRRNVKWIYGIYLWPLIFAFSRLYMGVHYPSDVISGIIVGFVFGFAAYRIIWYRFLNP